MTKISQLTDIGGGLAPNDEFIIRDVSDASTPNKKVTTSGFFAVASALGLTGFDIITAGNVATGTQVRAYASGIAGRVDTTISGITVARTTISGYYENASGITSGVLYPVVTQFDIGTSPNQVPLNQQLGTMAFQDAASIAVGNASIDQLSSIPLLTGGGLKFPPTQVSSADANTLDDYEEGTWTPTAVPSISGTITLSSITAAYTKIGNTISVYLQTTVSSVSSPLGYIDISLPFSNSVNSGGNVFFYNGDTGAVMSNFIGRITGSVFRMTFGTGQTGAPSAPYARANTEITMSAVYKN
jgi:hypothetical protein